MYKLPDGQVDIFSLIHPLEEMLDPENRWVRMAQEVPWDLWEQRYAAQMYSSRGAPAKPLRAMLGALIIKKTLGISEAETVRLIGENPYMQLFIGQPVFTKSAPFSPSALKMFRRRLTPEILQELRGDLKRCSTMCAI